MITFNNLGNLGRLGNQLFQISVAIGYAQEFGYNFGFSSDWVYKKYFKKELTDIDQKNYKIYQENCDYEELENVGDDVSFSGYFQSEKYFKNCEKLIKYYFEPKEEINKKNSCSIHIRRGDYINLGHVISLDYYIKSINYINNLDNKCNYVLFSDDIDWCKKNLNSFYKLNNHIEFFEKNEIESLFEMSNCIYSIVANSSLSWWGAWLGRKKIILRPEKPFKNEIREHYYPEEWIKIKN